MLPFSLVINVATLWGFFKACFNFSGLKIFCIEKQIKYQYAVDERRISYHLLMASRVENPTNIDFRVVLVFIKNRTIQKIVTDRC